MHTLIDGKVDERPPATDHQNTIILIDFPYRLTKSAIVGLELPHEGRSSKVGPLREPVSEVDRVLEALALHRRGIVNFTDASCHFWTGYRPLQWWIEEIGIHADRDRIWSFTCWCAEIN